MFWKNFGGTKHSIALPPVIACEPRIDSGLQGYCCRRGPHTLEGAPEPVEYWWRIHVGGVPIAMRRKAIGTWKPTRE